jgi:trimeric autotransporter adhesin
MKLRAACVLLLTLVPRTVAQAPTETASALPRLVRFSGTVKDLNGNPLTGVVGITFALYSEQTGGAALWLETQNVTADNNGHYVALLGSAKPDGLPTDLFTTEQARWVGAQVSGQAEQPRVLLVSAPYALKAGDAETIGGLPPSAFVMANGSHKNSAPPANPDVTGKGTVDYIPMWDTTSDIIDSIIFQKSSEIGINTTTPAALLDVNGKTDIRNTLTLYPDSTNNTLAVSGTSFLISSTGKVTFISGQTFPGTGTITGITTASGSGLSGGGTTGTLSLKVPSAGITNAMLADSKITLNASTAGGLTVPGAMTLGDTYTIGLKTCSANQVLQYVGTAWTCSNAGTGTITGVTTASGSGLAGGGTGGTLSLSVPSAGITNTMLQNSKITLNAGTGLTAPGAMTLGDTYTVSINTSVVPQLAAANTFTANQTVVGAVSASSSVANGYGVYGLQTATTGTNYGVLGVNNSINGAGVVGEGVSGVGGTSTVSPGGPGGYFIGYSAPQNSNMNGTDGVDGYGGSGDDSQGTTSTGGIGVFGNGGSGAYENGAGGFFQGGCCGTDFGDGVDATGVTFAGVFTGDVSVSGVCYGCSVVRIDHPLDPANKYFHHASVQSSEMKNMYDGTVTTDSQGQATVQLPEWFQVLNTDFRYQLTVIGQFAQAIVGHEIENNRFEIRTSAPNVKVSWQVTGVRQDAFAKAHPLVVEQEKEPRLRGYYIHPELYGAPPEKQIEWARHPQMMKKAKEMRARQLAAAQRPAVPAPVVLPVAAEPAPEQKPSAQK